MIDDRRAKSFTFLKRDCGDHVIEVQRRRKLRHRCASVCVDQHWIDVAVQSFHQASEQRHLVLAISILVPKRLLCEMRLIATDTYFDSHIPDLLLKKFRQSLGRAQLAGSL